MVVSQEPRTPDVSARASDCISKVPEHQGNSREKFLNPTSQVNRIQAKHRVTDCIAQVSKHRETRRIRFQSGFNFFSSPTRSVWWNNVCLSQSGGFRRRVNRSPICSKFLVMLERRIRKFSMRRTNPVCSIDTQSWCRILCSHWITTLPYEEYRCRSDQSHDLGVCMISQISRKTSSRRPLHVVILRCRSSRLRSAIQHACVQSNQTSHTWVWDIIL